MIRKCGIFIGWSLFLAGLVMTLCLVSVPRQKAEGPVTAVCFQTQNDADATLLYQDGAAVLIDTGEKADAQHIIEVLEKNGITELDCIVLSHPDVDHIGGAMEIAAKICVKKVVQPYYPKQDKEYLTVLNQWFLEQEIPIVYPTHTLRLTIGEMNLLVYPPLEKNYNQSNNYSLGLLVQHNNVKMMFAGDALRKRSEELLRINLPQVDMYKVAHHGRANSASERLFEVLVPRYAVVTADSADKSIVATAAKLETKMFYTASGDKIFVSDGNLLVPFIEDVN